MSKNSSFSSSLFPFIFHGKFLNKNFRKIKIQQNRNPKLFSLIFLLLISHLLEEKPSRKFHFFFLVVCRNKWTSSSPLAYNWVAESIELHINIYFMKKIMMRDKVNIWESSHFQTGNYWFILHSIKLFFPFLFLAYLLISRVHQRFFHFN